MRALSLAEIDQVGGGIDSVTIGGVSITGIEAGLAVRNVLGTAGFAFAAGYGVGTVLYNGYTAVNGESLGTDLYQYSN